VAFATVLVWRLRTGACGIDACGFWRNRMPPAHSIKIWRKLYIALFMPFMPVRPSRDKKFGFISAIKRLFGLFCLHVGFDSHRSQQTINILLRAWLQFDFAGKTRNVSSLCLRGEAMKTSAESATNPSQKISPFWAYTP